MHDRNVSSRTRCLVLATCLLFGLGGLASAGDDSRSMDEQLASAGLTVPQTQAFFEHLKAAVAAGNRSALAAVAQFPLAVAVGTDTVTLENASAFEQRYDEFMTPALVALVSRTRFDDLFANYQGVMIGDGAIWFGPVCEQDGDPQPIDSCKEAPIRVLRINGV